MNIAGSTLAGSGNSPCCFISDFPASVCSRVTLAGASLWGEQQQRSGNSLS